MFSESNEIITLALGHYASHIATHFYNVQEASFSYNPNFKSGINHDALFREASHHSKVTYTPRLIIADDTEALGFLSRDGYYKMSDQVIPEDNSGIDVTVEESLWEENEYIYDLVKEKQRTKKENNFNNDLLMKNSYNLDNCVASWSDYLITEFHERTIVTLPRNTDYYSNYEQFSNFQSGTSLWSKTQLHDDIEESTRFFMEEVDYSQGFQVIFDGDNGYSGIASSCLEMLDDEYSKKTIIAFPAFYTDLCKDEDLQAGYRKRCEKMYSLSSGLSLSSQYCDLVAPMSHVFNPWAKIPNSRDFKNIKYKHNLMYHTSAILAAALDLCTLPCRMQSQSTHLNNISSTISVYGRNIASIGLNIPFPLKREDTFSAMEKLHGNFFNSLSPLIEINPVEVDIQSVATKGLGKLEINYNSETVDDFLREYLHKNFPRVITAISSCKSSFRVPRTFPKLFNEQYNLSSNDNCYGPLSEFVAIGGIHNSRQIGNVLNSIYDEVKSIKTNRIPGFGPRDTEIDYVELFEVIKNLGLTYLDINYL